MDLDALAFKTLYGSQSFLRALDFERNGDLAEANEYWLAALSDAADEQTSDYCLDRARICAGLPDTESR